MFLEDIPLGQRIIIGSYTFTEEVIVDFARKFDPQPFHVDRAAAAKSPYGGIIASGWQTAAVWMKLMVAYLHENVSAERALSGFVSPGFREMRWFKPVRPGMTLAYSTENIAKLDWKPRPELGLLEANNEARDENDELMMSFIGRVLIPRRAK